MNRNQNSQKPAGRPAGLFHPELTLAELAQQRARLHPEQTYVTFLADGETEEHHLSYDRLDRSASRVAAWFQQQGLVKGDRVMVMLPNSLDFVQIFFGCLYAGVIAVPQPQQLQTYLKTFLPTIANCKPKALIASVSIVEYIRHQCPEDLRALFSPMTVVTAAEVLQSKEDSYLPPVIVKEDLAYLQYTSGSTGVPKGVMISHRNVLENLEQARIFGNWEEGRGTSLWLPLFHDFGLAAGLLGAMTNGGFVILMTPAHFMVKPYRWLETITRYRCAYSYAPPFGYDLCIRKITPDEKKQLDLSSLVSSVYGAEPVHYSSVTQFNRCFKECGLRETAVRPGFGMAETVIMFSESDRLRAISADRFELEHHGRLMLIEENDPGERQKILVNLGPAMHGHEIVIKDGNNRPLPEGHVGEIMLSGPSVCEGYYGNPEATRETFQQRIEGRSAPFLSTGDLGLLWQGCLYFTGRIKDLIIIRGKNFYPQDIEHAVPLGKEIRPGCVLAFADSSNENREKLILAMEIEGSLMRDQALLIKYIVPSVDNRIVAELGKQLQIYPDERMYLKPGTLKKTSSGKLKHGENRKSLMKPDIAGLLIRLPESTTTPDEDTDTVVSVVFQEVVGVRPEMDQAVRHLCPDQGIFSRFISALEDRYSFPDGDISDWVDEETTLADIARRLDEQLWSGMVAF